MTNVDTDDGAETFDTSTITIHFVVTLIKNLDYTNSTVFVTVGAEYDSQNYIYVSQAEYAFDMNPVSIILTYLIPVMISIDKYIKSVRIIYSYVFSYTEFCFRI